MALQPEIRPPGASPSAVPPVSGAIPDMIDPNAPTPEVKATARGAGGGTRRFGDRLFKTIAGAAGSTIVIAIVLIAVFLLIRAIPSLRANHANFFTEWRFDTNDASNLFFGIRDLFMVTVLSSIFALALAVPISVGIAVFLTQYAPARLARPFSVIVDLLAAVPSIIFG